MGKQEEKKSENKYTHTAIYAGRRLSNDGKKHFQRFIRTDNKEEMLFTGVVGCWIGYTYKCAASQISKRPERVRDIEVVHNPEWDAADALVDAKNAEKRAEAKMRANTKPAMKAAIAALKPLMRGLGHFERKALVEWLAEQTKNLKTS